MPIPENAYFISANAISTTAVLENVLAVYPLCRRRFLGSISQHGRTLKELAMPP